MPRTSSLVDSIIMSTRLLIASKNSTCSRVYGLKTSCMDFTVDRLNPYARTPPQVIRTIPISHELQLARQNQLHLLYVPFVDAVTWICFVLFRFSVYSFMMVLLPEGGMWNVWLLSRIRTRNKCLTITAATTPTTTKNLRRNRN